MSGSRGRPGGDPNANVEGRGRGRRTDGGRGQGAAPAGPPDRLAAKAGATTGSEAGGEMGGDRFVWHNRRRAVSIALLVGLVPGVVVGVVLALVGQPVAGLAALVGIAAGTSWWSWRTAPARVLRAVGGRPSHEHDHPRLHNLVDGLCASMGLPRPTIFIVDHEAPNAMAVGRDPSTASLIVTSALDRSLSLVQLEGVLAHELVHVKRGDTVLAGMAVTALVPWSVVVGVTRAGHQVHGLVGLGREFSADQQAAAVVRYPPGIGSALGLMADSGTPASWPPGAGRAAVLTRWLWIDPGVGPDGPTEGNLDDTRVRAEAQSLL